MMYKRIPKAQVHKFIVDCMSSVNVKKEHGVALADVLVAADCRGHYSHGLNRIEMYIKDVETKNCAPNNLPEILNQTQATAWVHGNNTLGPVVGNFCMDLAIQKAKKCGAGVVIAKGSNHYGMAAWYSMQALKHNMLGITGCNTSPLMCPTRSKQALLGTNPISFAAPSLQEDSFVLDMATTAVSVGKIEVQMRRNESIPANWALDSSGKVSTDAQEAFKAARLMPLGGSEETSGYKGYGLALMVEALCGIAGGSAFGPNIINWTDTSRQANLGQFFIAIDTECFCPNFPTRMDQMMSSLRESDKADPEKPVLVPGDPERIKENEVQTNDGILYHVNQIQSCELLASRLGIESMKAK